MGNQFILPIKTAESFIKDVLSRLGVSDEDIRICADVLLTADIQGVDFEGISLLKAYYDKIKGGFQIPQTNIRIIKETDTTATMDGGYGMGEVVSYRAMEKAIEKAKKYGLGSVAVRNSSHFGMAGYYVRMAIKENMMGLAVTNASPTIAPTFGVEPMLGTNPIAFGAPSDMEFPFVMDFAASVVRKHKIDNLARDGEPIPEGWAINRDGNPHIDGIQLQKDIKARTAAIFPLGGEGELLGGHKGYGLATMMEILSASLQDGAFMRGLQKLNQDNEPVLYGPGHFFLAVNIENFTDVNRCKHIVGEIMRGLQNSKKMPGRDKIYVAGEKEYERQKLLFNEGIPLSKDTRRKLKKIQDELSLSDYNF